ncbi:peptidoglycan-binding protein [Streptomyces sp. NBC_01201]|uniref:peptidoglycan-binding domain-containing protein n=1 Tax=unclassified Streptomyces TaxID=2593676 RepID=UPI0011C84625|nr:MULTISPECIES: peptidoglycan-binding domain-containing protein [unclassified Streptomyces]TXS08726.1 peptidoglycan-binding protein [Streptomyces sp. wa22]WSQ80234.1 peptidoglycan-binding protein [Streptomyces sp. NBC_01213]WSQ87565.1 peptidoglycan-binding protein [Streptomyces sp. NBC_01212]WSR50968.1 peptidoglycan-binding protein [Streptomyces sp. NBC_01201]
MTGHMCPECGGEQSARPGAGCACGAGAATRPGRDARSAEIAAAEDFDPLRIRPYVTLNSEDTEDHGTPDAATTMPLFLDGAPGREAAGSHGSAPGARPDATAADDSRRRSAAAYAGGGPDPVQPRRRRPFVVVAVGAAVAAVVGTAAFAGGLFDDRDDREAALPEATTSVPDAGEEPAASVPESPSASPSPTPSRSESASASASASPSESASPSQSPSASPSASVPQSPSPSATETKATGTEAAAPPAEEVSGATLRRGDSGAEVSELQRRLQEIWVYRGPENGDYSAQVEQAVAEYQRWVSVRSDPSGVYGPETRSALEAQTSGRGRRS